MPVARDSFSTFFASAVLCAGLSATAFALDTTTRESVSSAGAEGLGESLETSISADGRFVVFISLSNNFSPLDTNSDRDVYLRDRQSGTTVLVSVNVAGTQATGNCWEPVVSADGRYVAFWSDSSLHVVGDTNNKRDVFVRDVIVGTTEAASVNFLGDFGNGHSTTPSISADGRYVSFESSATNLVPHDVNTFADIFVRDRVAGSTTRVSVGPGGVQSDDQSSNASISADGRFIAFHSNATNLVSGDTNATADVFVHDLVLGTTTRASIAYTGAEPSHACTAPSISLGGRYVAFQSPSHNLVSGDTNGQDDVFLRDMLLGTTERLSVSSSGQEGNSASHYAAISPDGRFVAFQSSSTNLVAGDTSGWRDCFVRDVTNDLTYRATLSYLGFEPNADCEVPAVSADGRSVVWYSTASNLVPADANGKRDVFLRRLDSIPAWSSMGSALAGTSGLPALTATGGFAPLATTQFQAANFLPSTFGAHVLGLNNLSLPLFGGLLVPSLDVIKPFLVSPSGTAPLTMNWPISLPLGLTAYVQSWAIDAGAVAGFSATNALGSL